jgi:hypothetical protein
MIRINLELIESATISLVRGMTGIIGNVILSSSVATKLFSQATTFDWILYSVCLLFVWAHYYNNKMLKKEIAELKSKLYLDEAKLEHDLKEVYLSIYTANYWINKNVYNHMKGTIIEKMTPNLLKRDYNLSQITYMCDKYLDKVLQQNATIT